MARKDDYLEHLARMPMFSTCSKKELQAVAKRATSVRIPEGQQLTTEGSMGHEAYVIVDGKAKVTRGRKQLAMLGSGDFFGELALLDKAPRTATVTATTPMEVLHLDGREFESLLEEAPSITRKMLQGLAQRLRETDARI